MTKFQQFFLALLSALMVVLVPTTSVATDFGTLPTNPKDSLPMALGKPAARKAPLITPKAPDVNAKSYILVDADSGKILAQKEPDLQLPPASLTKLMTTYIAASYLKSGQIKLTDMVPVSRKAWEMGGSRMFIKAGTEVSVADLIKGIIVSSGNDASVALAEHIAGSEEAFVNLMNHQAEALGMKNTSFTDATGMPADDHYSTARDMALLSHALIREYPQYYAWFKEKSFTYNNIKQNNRNRLLWRFKFADGLKTGHTKAAGYCLASSAKKDDMRLIAVVMGSETDNKRMEDSLAILNYGFRFFETHRLFKAGKTVTQARVWMGKYKTAPLGVAEPLMVTIPRGGYNRIKALAEVIHPLKAPLTKGNQYGYMHIQIDNKDIAKIPLVALAEVPEGGWWNRMTDYVSLTVRDYFKGNENPTQEVS